MTQEELASVVMHLQRYIACQAIMAGPLAVSVAIPGIDEPIELTADEAVPLAGQIMRRIEATLLGMGVQVPGVGI